MDEGTSDRPTQPRKRKPSTKVLENGDVPKAKRPRQTNMKDKVPPDADKVPSPISQPVLAVSGLAHRFPIPHRPDDSDSEAGQGSDDTEAVDDVIIVETADIPEDPGEDAEAELSEFLNPRMILVVNVS